MNSKLNRKSVWCIMRTPNCWNEICFIRFNVRKVTWTIFFAFYQNRVFGNMWISIIYYMGFLVHTNFPFFSWLFYSDYPYNLRSPNQSETTELNLFNSKAIVFGPMLPKQMLCFWNVQVGEYEMQYSGPII